MFFKYLYFYLLLVIFLLSSCQGNKEKEKTIRNSFNQNSVQKSLILRQSSWNKDIFKPKDPTLKNVTVYRSEGCLCCSAWVQHMKYHQYSVQEILVEDMSLIKEKYKISSDLEACHTAIFQNYVIEGHVPAQDIKTLLDKKPSINILSVPGMPFGSPGMEDKKLYGDKKDPFSVIAVSFQSNKKYVFHTYTQY